MADIKRCEIIQKAIKHIAAGDNAVCYDCGWMGRMVGERRPCPSCGKVLMLGHRIMAAYALTISKERSS